MKAPIESQSPSRRRIALVAGLICGLVIVGALVWIIATWSRQPTGNPPAEVPVPSPQQ